MGQCTLNYVSDYDYYPPKFFVDSSGNRLKGLNFMGTQYGTEMYEPHWGDIQMQMGYFPKSCGVKYNTRYLAYGGFLRCPESSMEDSHGKYFLSEKPGTLASYANTYPAYVYNACVVSEDKTNDKYWGPGVGINSGMKVAQLKFPSSTMLYADGSYVSIDAASPGDFGVRFSKRHNRALNMAHCDGSVATYKQVFSTFYLLYGGVNRR